jgi:outer membrane protein assembly factor BamB
VRNFMIAFSKILLVGLLLGFAGPALGQQSVIKVQGNEAEGVAFALGEDLLVTSARLGNDLKIGEASLPLLSLTPKRGISLCKFKAALPIAILAEKPILSKDEHYFFLTPEPLSVEYITASNDALSWQLAGEVWLVKSPHPVPSGAPLVRESDKQVLGLAVTTRDGVTAIVCADQIRLACFDAGAVLPKKQPGSSGPAWLFDLPYGGARGQEFHLTDVRRLEAWREMMGLLPTYQTSLVAVGDLLYFGDKDGKINCVDIQKRTLVWSQNLEWPVIFPPQVVGDTLYVMVFGLRLEKEDRSLLFTIRHWYARGVSILYAMDRNTGEVRWRHISGLRPNILPYEGKLFFGGLSGYGALNEQTGSSTWIEAEPLRRKEFPSWFVLNPLAHGKLPLFAVRMRLRDTDSNRVLLCSGEMYLLLLDPATGKISQRINFGDIPDSYHPFATVSYLPPDEKSLMLAAGKLVRAYSRPEGRLLWEYKLDGNMVPGSVVYANALLLPTDEPAVQLVSDTGKLRWSYKQLTGAPGAILLQDQRLYFGALDGYLYCLSAETGDCLWKLECPGGKISGAPVIINQILYVTASDGRIYAVALSETDFQ